MPYAPINDVKQTLEHKHVIARDMIKTVHHPTVGPIRLINTPVKYSESTPGIRSPPPTLGQHTDEVLTTVLGMGEEEIKVLKGEGVLG
jgi:succinate--hydroxymethylglutarate CoA-transferase